MNLIIVESPTKARTLTRFLGKDFRVEASMGHLRDLPKSSLGVDIEHEFTPKYIIPKGKASKVKELREFAKKSESVILATDPDREGEAIAWHIAQLLKKSTYQRIVFHEITQQAIKAALANPRSIDMQLVDAQQARRVLDRLVGYKLSPLLWQKLSRRWLSAGRVQSVAVRLIVEREREIVKFTKLEFWTIEGDFSKLRAQLVAKDGVKYEQILEYELFDGKYTTTSSTINDRGAAEKIMANLKSPFTVSAVDKKEIRRYPTAPYTTSTLQQDAGRRLYFSSKRTMQLAQKLYEEGLITYHRTDSVNLAEKFLDEAKSYIQHEFGAKYLADKPRRFQTKSKVAQEAHEAIRPTNLSMTNDKLPMTDKEFNRDHLRLYELIWKRALASQMAEAIFDSTTIDIVDSNGYQFQTQGSVVKFDGFLKINGHPASPAGRENGEMELPVVTVGDILQLTQATPTEHFTSPPPRYTEASLVKTLEEKEIGRPSTYAPIISTILDRQYVTKEDLPAGRQGKKLVPTDLGIAVTDFLVQYFDRIIDLPFTAQLEESLDDVANGQKQWVPLIREFYEPFAQILEQAYIQAEQVKLEVEKIGEKCPDCGSDLVIKFGRYGKFIACSGFPACKYTRQIVEKLGTSCPRCGADIVIKKTKRGKIFYGCGNYPKCDFAAWKKEDIK